MSTADITLTIITFLCFLSYFPLNRRLVFRYLQTKLDQFIPLLPVFVIPYALFKPFVALAIISNISSPQYHQLILSLLLASSICVTTWIIFPTGVKRPSLPITNLPTRLLALIYRHDGDANAAPSAHVAYTIVSNFFLNRALPQHAIIFTLLATLIIYSTIFTKQHYFIDLIAGAVVGFSSLAIILMI